eukprot:CAMPEP_0116946880 /NCGR_PEP_ID=MMETSP0467-20121206/37292_1 /TAXON_ID=283647 /ORGANISM="Mesodinium pulex, Strain SPMC105" /LENGTH=66 /DNA_ID=CAMNT_0004630829 /DNA_START=312 /DNA_END=512 /DNA_ORIENTATION=-
MMDHSEELFRSSPNETQYVHGQYFPTMTKAHQGFNSLGGYSYMRHVKYKGKSTFLYKFYEDSQIEN